ncbi:hypothetical protein GUJ93_ZPchr0010g9351 [Zizania palustris]|uniref:Uncharacterized protein n=1 Tax=Zizania palustris TaxID=103762 RepID=A0A8J6BND7_ZIZPA|nr:hypothetical protein GUJ93_ZPchr0010g9351 [Zizania palustris]
MRGSNEVKQHSHVALPGSLRIGCEAPLLAPGMCSAAALAPRREKQAVTAKPPAHAISPKKSRRTAAAACTSAKAILSAQLPTRACAA